MTPNERAWMVDYLAPLCLRVGGEVSYLSYLVEKHGSINAISGEMSELMIY